MKQAPIAVLVKALEVGSIDKETGLAEGMFELVHIWKGHISSKQFYVPVYSATFISEEAISVESGKYYVMNLEPDVAAGADHYKRFGCVPILETGKPSPENPKIKYINEHFIDKTRK